MSTMRFESVPRIFDLSFDNKQCQLILKIHKGFFKLNEDVTLDRIEFYAKERLLKYNNLDYKYCFNLDGEEFGFEGVFKKTQSSDDEFVWFQVGDFKESFKISATLHVLFFLAQFYYNGMKNGNKKTFTQAEQKIEIEIAFTPNQSWGFHILGSCSEDMSKVIRNFTEKQIEEIIDTLVAVSTNSTGKDESEHRYFYRADPYNDILQINYPSALSGLWLTVGKGEICGHNIDRAYQQVVLLCALAKVCDFCE